MMRLDKHSPNKSNRWPLAVDLLAEGEADDEGQFKAAYQSHIRTIINRAVIGYVGLFGGLGGLLSLGGINPLANQGLLPKTLFVFVGLSLLIALVNTLTDFSQRHGSPWTDLIRGLVRSSQRRRPQSK
jgi:hypothetical protein